MIDALVFVMIIIGIIIFFLFILYISDNFKKQLYWCIGLIFLLIACWITLRELARTENYRIDKNTIFVNNISILNDNKNIIFNKKLKVEVIEFDMPLSGILDYTNYRIYLDSLTYIIINSSSFDSLHLKYGKKLYKE